MSKICGRSTSRFSGNPPRSEASPYGGGCSSPLPLAGDAAGGPLTRPEGAGRLIPRLVRRGSHNALWCVNCWPCSIPRAGCAGPDGACGCWPGLRVVLPSGAHGGARAGVARSHPRQTRHEPRRHDAALPQVSFPIWCGRPRSRHACSPSGEMSAPWLTAPLGGGAVARAGGGARSLGLLLVAPYSILPPHQTHHEPHQRVASPVGDSIPEPHPEARSEPPAECPAPWATMLSTNPPVCWCWPPGLRRCWVLGAVC
jgi:hypothetical protein